MKRKISPANEDSPLDVQQLDAERPDNDRAQGFYDDESDTNNSRTPVRIRAVSEGEGAPNSQQWHRSSNSEGSNREFAFQRGRQQLVGEEPGQQIRRQEISGGPPPNLNDQPPDCWQVNGMQEELAKTQQSLNRYVECSSQVETRSGTHESDTTSLQHGDRQPTDPTSMHYNILNQVEEYPRESSPGFPQANINIPEPDITLDNEIFEWDVLEESAFL